MKPTAFLLSVLLVMSGVFAGASAYVVAPVAGTEILITLGGDCTLASVEWALRHPSRSFDGHIERFGYAYPFAGIESVVAHDDLTVVNLENVFYNGKKGRVDKKFSFKSATDFAKILPAGSIEAVNIANNHILDYGRQGLYSTIEALENEGVGWFGATEHAAGTWIYEKNGIKIGFTGAYIGFWRTKRDALSATFRELKEAGCDLIIASMHGGTEYTKRHDRHQTDMAHWMIGEGAALVFGHHPHVLQGVEVADGRTVLYSLGNLSFGGNPRLRADVSMLAQVRLVFGEDKTYLGHQLNLLPIRPSGTPEYNDYQPVLLTGDEAQAVIDRVQQDTPFALNPYVDGVGALQEFVPAPPND